MYTHNLSFVVHPCIDVGSSPHELVDDCDLTVLCRIVEDGISGLWRGVAREARVKATQGR